MRLSWNRRQIIDNLGDRLQDGSILILLVGVIVLVAASGGGA